MELTEIKGIGPKTSALLNKLDIYSSEDLIHFYPFRYNVYTPSNILESEDDEIIVVSGYVETPPKMAYIRRNFNKIMFKFVTSNISCNVIIFNRAFLARNITVGKQLTLIGKYNKFKNTFTANDIKFMCIKKTEVEPVYHTVHGLSTSTLKKAISVTLEETNEIHEIIPEYINNRYEFMPTLKAVNEIHNPSSSQALKQAKIKLKYEELFDFMFKINLMKFKNKVFDDFNIKNITNEMLDEVMSYIPFELTEDQKSALDDIVNDYKSEKRMNRLILGDVGSGKTIVSFLAILLNYKCGYQSALLSPTEVLSQQHYQNFIELTKNLGIKTELLVGSLHKKEKRDIIDRLKSGEIDVIIGTHALLEESVEFANIGLVITDEQHRFGVNQRKCLQNKGHFVDVLYMSATPIPRTYALTIYGDMDISMIKQKPSGRKDIITRVYQFSNMDVAMKDVKKELDQGHQAYIISPLIEETEDSNISTIENIENILTKYIPSEYRIGILHGKMNSKTKDEIMRTFKDGEIDVLISTTVIEVGVDVKNATSIVIFNAERFGLATLHQLRGRVGRSNIQSQCILISDSETERLKVLEESNDGFYISEQDFKLRGSGDLFGVRQSGDMIFKIADLRTDYKILLQCKKDAEEFTINNIENNFRDYKHYERILKELMNND